MGRVPQRTCIGCRARLDKGELVRFVRRPDGSVARDPTGKEPGRGAYVHRSAECLALATQRGALARALRVPRAQDLATLTADMESGT